MISNLIPYHLLNEKARNMMIAIDNVVLVLKPWFEHVVSTTTEKMLVVYHFLGGFLLVLLALAVLSAGANLWMFRSKLARALSRRKQKKLLGTLKQRQVNVVRHDGTTLPAMLLQHDRPDSPLVLDIGNGCLKYVTSDGEFKTKSSIFTKWEEVSQ